jgi:hypothetical protein
MIGCVFARRHVSRAWTRPHPPRHTRTFLYHATLELSSTTESCIVESSRPCMSNNDPNAIARWTARCTDAAFPSLSSAERRIMVAIGRGVLESDVSVLVRDGPDGFEAVRRALGLSPHTVRSHVRTIIRKISDDVQRAATRRRLDRHVARVRRKTPTLEVLRALISRCVVTDAYQQLEATRRGISPPPILDLPLAASRPVDENDSPPPIVRRSRARKKASGADDAGAI